MLAALLLAAPLAWGAGTPPAAARLEAALSSSAAARRLLAADDGVPRREAHSSGLPLAVDERGGPAPEIVVDLERVGDLPPGEAEAEYARALALAEIAEPVPIVEAEEAARQWTAQVLLEAALSEAPLSRALAAAEASPPPRAPVLGRSAAFIGRFEREPGSAWRSVESGGGLPPEAASLTALEDLFALHAADIRALKEPPSEAYVSFGGRRYPSALVRAAYLLRAPGALQRLRESLGAFDSVGVAPLQDAIFRWRRSRLEPER